jgi:hypothetical protein
MSTTEQTRSRYFALCERAMQAEPEYSAAREAFELAVERGGYTHACKWQMATVVMAEIRKTWMAPVAQALEELACGQKDLAATRAELEQLRQYHSRQLCSDRSWEHRSNNPEANRLGELEATVRAEVIGAIDELCEIELIEETRPARRK